MTDSMTAVIKNDDIKHKQPLLQPHINIQQQNSYNHHYKLVNQANKHRQHIFEQLHQQQTINEMTEKQVKRNIINN